MRWSSMPPPSPPETLLHMPRLCFIAGNTGAPGNPATLHARAIRAAAAAKGLLWHRVMTGGGAVMSPGVPLHRVV